jgi:hypothetical protein
MPGYLRTSLVASPVQILISALLETRKPISHGDRLQGLKWPKPFYHVMLARAFTASHPGIYFPAPAAFRPNRFLSFLVTGRGLGLVSQIRTLVGCLFSAARAFQLGASSVELSLDRQKVVSGLRSSITECVKFDSQTAQYRIQDGIQAFTVRR